MFPVAFSQEKKLKKLSRIPTTVVIHTIPHVWIIKQRFEFKTSTIYDSVGYLAFARLRDRYNKLFRRTILRSEFKEKKKLN